MSDPKITSFLKLETSVQPFIPAKREMYTLFSGGNICEPAHLFSKIMIYNMTGDEPFTLPHGRVILSGINLAPPFPSYGKELEKRVSFLAVELSEELKKSWAQHATGLYALKDPEDSPPISFANLSRRVDGVWSVTAGDKNNSYLVGQLDQSTINSLMLQLKAPIPFYQRSPQFPGLPLAEDDALYVGYLRTLSNHVLAGKNNFGDGVAWPSVLGVPKDCLKLTINPEAPLPLIPRSVNYGYVEKSDQLLIPLYSARQIEEAKEKDPHALRSIEWTPSWSFTHGISEKNQVRSIFEGPGQPPKTLPRALEEFIQAIDTNPSIEDKQKVTMVVAESSKHGLPEVDKKAAQYLLDSDPAFYILHEPSLKELCERTELYAVHAHLISSAFKSSRTEAGLSLVSEQLGSMLNNQPIEKNIKMLSAIRGFLPADSGASEFELIYKSVISNDPTYESKSQDLLPAYLQLQDAALDQDDRQRVIVDLITSLRDIESTNGPKVAAASFMELLSQGDRHSSDEWNSLVNRLVHFEGSAPQERPGMRR